MHDEQMTEEKKKIIHLLLSHMTGRFYPLACQSFAVPDMTVDRAVTAMARKKNLPWADNKRYGTASFGSTSISGWSWLLSW